MTVDQAEGPLAGLLVADFSRILAGPYATMLLADMGAEVIKVEGPGGDDTRTWQPPVRDGISTYYLGVNRNKRSVALDLRDPGDLAAAHELARRADVFVENFKPGGLARFGLDYEAVSAANSAVVYASIRTRAVNAADCSGPLPWPFSLRSLAAGLRHAPLKDWPGSRRRSAALLRPSTAKSAGAAPHRAAGSDAHAIRSPAKPSFPGTLSSFVVMISFRKLPTARSRCTRAEAPLAL